MTDTLLIDAVLSGERRALARAITLIESTRRDHHVEANRLLEALMPHTGNSIRVGISGAPGVGKSTFIEALGNHVIDQGHKVAVLTVDPSSAISGGSILGDKTRMETLARRPEAFIRPSPAGTTLGGVTRREAQQLVRAHGGVPVERVTPRVDLIVIGADELPLTAQDELLDEATRAAAADGRLEIISETRLWERLGLVDNEQNVHRLYTPAMLADLLGVNVAVIRV